MTEWSELNIVLANVYSLRGFLTPWLSCPLCSLIHCSSGYKDEEHLFTQIFAQREFKAKCVDSMKQGHFCFCLSYDSKGFWLLKFGMLLKDMKANITINLKQNDSQLHLSNEHLIYNFKTSIIFGTWREIKWYLESGFIYYPKTYWAYCLYCLQYDILFLSTLIQFSSANIFWIYKCLALW